MEVKFPLQTPRHPSEKELSDRVTRHLAARADAKEVVIAWRSYFAALMEWGLLHPEVYERVLDLLPSDAGKEEISEIMLGPDYKEVQRQLDEEDLIRRGL